MSVDTDQLNEVYADRNQVAMLAAAFALSLGLPAGWAVDPKEPSFPVLIVSLPHGHGQISFHVPEQEATQFDIGPYPGEWDGHTTAVKRRRIADFLLYSEQTTVPRMPNE